ncbi:unnamed protein product [Protopolystoma xenopodis]|uniref:Uncharacterized protein n=1 Tax=Protopolystoma xenopodis TaxID=117903 RepID=A0A3S5B4V6_9PLAT|nr:unnamed protein product [Protopolystoma xenopodis]
MAVAFAVAVAADSPIFSPSRNEPALVDWLTEKRTRTTPQLAANAWSCCRTNSPVSFVSLASQTSLPLRIILYPTPLDNLSSSLAPPRLVEPTSIGLQSA